MTEQEIEQVFQKPMWQPITNQKDFVEKHIARWKLYENKDYVVVAHQRVKGFDHELSHEFLFLKFGDDYAIAQVDMAIEYASDDIFQHTEKYVKYISSIENVTEKEFNERMEH